MRLADDPPPPHLPQALAQAQRLKTEVKAAMGRLAAEEGGRRINLTDNDAQLMKGKLGILVGYNMQAVVSPVKVEGSKGSGLLITGVDVVKDKNDAGSVSADARTGRGNDWEASRAFFG